MYCVRTFISCVIKAFHCKVWQQRTPPHYQPPHLPPLKLCSPQIACLVTAGVARPFDSSWLAGLLATSRYKGSNQGIPVVHSVLGLLVNKRRGGVHIRDAFVTPCDVIIADCRRHGEAEGPALVVTISLPWW